MKRRIVYLSWPTEEITGGIKMAFRHVEALCENGFDAVVATQDGRAPLWFSTTASVISLDGLGGENDVLVFPENHEGFLHQFADRTCPKIVFCQSQHMVWRGLGDRLSYAEFGISDIICPGHTAALYCRRRFPDLNVEVITNYVDRERFRPATTKTLQIVLIPHKRASEAQVIRDLFRAQRPEFREIPWRSLESVSEAEVARVLGESAVFLSLCRLEACPLTLLEAMASGCVIAGFNGLGGADYTTARNGFWAPEDDCPACEEALARAVEFAAGKHRLYYDMVDAGLETARAYNREQFVRRLTEFWSAFTDEKSTVHTG